MGFDFDRVGPVPGDAPFEFSGSSADDFGQSATTRSSGDPREIDIAAKWCTDHEDFAGQGQFSRWFVAKVFKQNAVSPLSNCAIQGKLLQHAFHVSTLPDTIVPCLLFIASCWFGAYFSESW